MEGLQTQLPEQQASGLLPFSVYDESSVSIESREGLRVSEAEYWETWYHDPVFCYEWNNGLLEVRPVSDYDGYVMGEWLVSLLREFIKAWPIARTVGMDIGFRMAFGAHVSIRRPDYAVILNTNPTAIQGPDASYRGTYDLCLEFLSYSSSSDIKRDTVLKKREYAGGGVQEYFILDPRGLESAFYRLNRHHHYEPIEPVKGDIIHSGVLPGFQFRLPDIYHQPDFKTLIHGPVYQDYVLRDYQQERQRAEQAEKQWVVEKRRAELAEERASQLAAQLRALGVSVPGD